MEKTLIEVYVKMVQEQRCSSEDILVVDELRDIFVSNSQNRLGSDYSKEAILRKLCNLRKRSKLPRTKDILAA